MIVAIWVFTMQVVDTAWFVLPSGKDIGVLGAFMAVAAVRRFRRRVDGSVLVAVGSLCDKAVRANESEHA